MDKRMNGWVETQRNEFENGGVDWDGWIDGAFMDREIEVQRGMDGEMDGWIDRMN